MAIRFKKPRPLKSEQGKYNRWQQKAQRWLATGTLVAYAASGSMKTALAQQPASGGPAQSPGTNTLSVIPFNIPAGSLSDALHAFQAATGLHVETARTGLLTLTTNGVSGQYTWDVALKMLLQGTGLTYKNGATGITLDIATVATTVEVSTEAGILSTSTVKYSEPLRDTPQSITAIPRAVLDQQANTTLRDALRNVSGISIAAGEGGAQGDNLTIRGFSARNDLFIDGMRDFGSYYRDPFNTEEVEIFQGPSSVTFGRGSTGGVVNQASKAPRLNRFFNAEGDFGTDATRRALVDVGIPLPKLGNGTAFRLNVMGNQGGVAGRDIAENRRWGVAPSLEFGLGTPTRVTFSYVRQKADDTPDYGIPWLFNGPAPVNRRNYYGFEDGNFLRTTADIGTAKVEHDVNSRWTIRDQFRYANYDRDVRITEPRIAGTLTLQTPLSEMIVSRNELTNRSVEAIADDQVDLIGRFKTGIFEHSVTTGIEVSRESSNPTRTTWTNVPTTSLLNPDPYQPFAGTGTISSVVKTTAVSAGAYLLDTVRFGQKWEASGGLRWDRFGADYDQTVGAISHFKRVDNMTSWRAALVYKPVQSGSIYVAAGTSFNPSAESLALSAATVSLPPEENRNYEVGTKWDANRGRLSARAAFFRTDKLNAREPDPTNATLNVLAGQQRVNGATVEMNGRITSRWNMLAGYTHLDAKLVASKAFPAAVGAQLANVPANTLNFWSNVRLPWRSQFGAGGNYVAARTASSTAPLDPTTGLVKALPGYWVFNAMFEHRITEHVEVQANAFNLANRYYYDQLHPAHIVLGPGRSALIGLKFKF